MKFDDHSPIYKFDPKVTIDDIKDYYRLNNNNGPFFSLFETGVHGRRFDMVRINPWKRMIWIFEFKSSRGDFTSDKKWQHYLRYCHIFTFVCPYGVIQKEELPKGIGLLWVYKWTWKRDRDEPKWMIDADYVKRPRSREMEVHDLLDMAFIISQRVIYRKDDFF